MANKKADTDPMLAIKSGVLQVPAYPLHLVRVLMQIGHEPLPPFKAKSIFNREMMYYPNVFKYLRYIYSVEGITGLYRGVGMRVASQVVATITYNQTLKKIEDDSNIVDQKDSDEFPIEVLCQITKKDIIARCWAVVISHPFHVMGLRCMAQFVGGETNYSSWNIVQNTLEIWRGEGAAGFFSGVIPRILFEASTIVITNAFVYIIKTYIFNDKDVDALNEAISSLLASSITYPLSLVSTVSSISGSSIMAARPPRMPAYSTWIDVFKHLSSTNQLKRGASSFYRTYSPVMVNVNAMANGYKLA